MQQNKENNVSGFLICQLRCPSLSDAIKKSKIGSRKTAEIRVENSISIFSFFHLIQLYLISVNYLILNVISKSLLYSKKTKKNSYFKFKCMFSYFFILLKNEKNREGRCFKMLTTQKLMDILQNPLLFS